MGTDVDEDCYAVYMVTSAGMPLDHIAIFVETHEIGPMSGHIFQVSGNIQQGMYHNHRAGSKPEEDIDSAFVSKCLLGYVTRKDYETGMFRELCDRLEAPPKQFNGPRRIDPGTPLRRCGEWAWDAVRTLQEKGVLVDCVAQLRSN